MTYKVGDRVAMTCKKVLGLHGEIIEVGQKSYVINLGETGCGVWSFAHDDCILEKDFCLPMEPDMELDEIHEAQELMK